MFKKLLVANRGTIAIRIIRACRELGISTVAVFSTADKNALHVRMADESVCIGPPAAEDSYLNIPAILSAATTFGADAVHPGYGFLSENGDFAEACQKSGLNFVGPRARHIRLMGDKPRARRIMKRAGVPVLPGSEGTGVTELREAQVDAKRLGYPVLIKAAAGGGGKGMRVVRTADELTRLFALAQGESEASFSSKKMYLEKYLERARHVEFQILADLQRNAIHLGERDCSIQRRHQKVVEESPCPILTPRLREKMGKAAVRAAEVVGYSNVGSVAREIVEKHLDLCLAAGINHEGINAEVAKGQWEFQIFGKGSKKAADEMWMARYLLQRLTETYGIDVEYHCKPLGDTDWNGSGMHANFSTTYLRETGGKAYFEALMAAFEKNLMDHIAVYGPDNDKRLTGKHETAPWNKFSYGVADRGASVRVPHSFIKNDYKGYLEDRRPNSQGDPYQIASQILKTVASVPTGAKAAAA